MQLAISRRCGLRGSGTPLGAAGAAQDCSVISLSFIGLEQMTRAVPFLSYCQQHEGKERTACMQQTAPSDPSVTAVSSIACCRARACAGYTYHCHNAGILTCTLVNAAL